MKEKGKEGREVRSEEEWGGGAGWGDPRIPLESAVMGTMGRSLRRLWFKRVAGLMGGMTPEGKHLMSHSHRNDLFTIQPQTAK